jgi:hypothetical protein
LDLIESSAVVDANWTAMMPRSSADTMTTRNVRCKIS